MKGHEPTSRSVRHLTDREVYRTECVCGWAVEWPADGERPRRAYHSDHVEDMVAELRRFQRDYYQRTGHCGACGQPGTFCLCTDREPCGCRGLHRMGSGLDADPVEVFAAVPVSDDQGELFA